MVRLFTGVELGARTRGAVVARQAEIAAAIRTAGDRELRMTGPDQLHLTLVFIGETDDAQARTVEAAFGPPIPMAPFTIEFGACGTFPPAGAPRVLWLGISRGAGALSQIHGVVSARLETAGIPPERRPYEPHLTIGRWRNGGLPSLRRALSATPWSVAGQVDYVTLFRSRLLPGGAEHTVIARAPLVGHP
jgi:2'-5' RNA ligase